MQLYIAKDIVLALVFSYIHTEWYGNQPFQNYQAYYYPIHQTQNISLFISTLKIQQNILND